MCVFTKHQALVLFEIVHGDQLIEFKAEKWYCENIVWSEFN